MFSRCNILTKFRFWGCKISQSKNISDTKRNTKYDKFFFQNEVQNILRSITIADPEKIFRVRSDNKPFKTPSIDFMTADQVEFEKLMAKKRMEKLLQMPPVVDPVEDKLEILDTNPSMDGFDKEHSKIVVTDISEGYHNEDRIIVVREPNGVLRKANRNERHRMNEIYFPMHGRKYEIPKMFEDEQLKDLIAKKEYIFILDRACLQFDPDDPMYHKVIELTYEDINEKFHFEMLQSTRHFGSLAFYLAVHKNIDNLLIHMLRNERLSDAVSLVELYYIVHQSGKKVEGSNKSLLENFIKQHANQKELINMELETYFRKVENNKDMEKEIKTAHGIK